MADIGQSRHTLSTFLQNNMYLSMNLLFLLVAIIGCIHLIYGEHSSSCIYNKSSIDEVSEVTDETNCTKIKKNYEEID